MTWPTNYPDDCPPNDAVTPNHTVYRFIKDNPPVKRDFSSHVDKSPTSTFTDRCKACGISVFIDLEEAIAAQSLIPGIAKKMIALCAISHDDGRIKHTPKNINPEHYTWWKPVEFDINRFTKVEDSG